MIHRSLGAGTLALFWRYWNPVWGYYLSRYIYSPALKWLPSALALIVTFAVSGALHDFVISLIRKEFTLIFVP